MSDNEQAWRDGLKASDEVIIDGVIKTVSRTTRTQIVVQMTPNWEQKFSRKDGRSIGRSSYSTLWIRQPTAERRARADMMARDKAAMAVINKTRFADLSVEKLERIVAIIQEGN